jgi:nucleoside-diphosphate-sugar epimerase
MKVAIIGSNSFLANYIIREFISIHIKPELFGMSPSLEYPELSFNLFKFPDAQINMDELLAFDIIIYTAGAGIQSNLKESIEIVYELNSFYPIKIFNFLSENHFHGKVITFGSYFEIGNETEEIYYTEMDVALSKNYLSNQYASSKRILTRFLTSSPDLPVYFHFILPNIYGNGENENRLIPYLINSLNQGTEIKLTSGTQVRQFIHASDVAKAVLNVAGNEYQKGLYNLCDSEPIQIKQLVQIVFGVKGREADFNNLNFGNNQRTDTSMPFLLLNNEKAKMNLDFVPSISLEEGIKLYV